MTYHRVVASLAAPRTNSDDLIRDLQFVARRLYFSAAVGPEDKQFLQDFARDEQRYQLRALQRLVYCASRSTKPEDREALAEYVRGHCLRAIAVPTDPRLLGDLETAAQGPHDMTWRDFERTPSRATRDRAIETGTAHLRGLRAELDLLQHYPC